MYFNAFMHSYNNAGDDNNVDKNTGMIIIIIIRIIIIASNDANTQSAAWM